MGPPADHDGAIAVLREAVAQGVTHIDTSDAYGPRVANELIREALHPYPESVLIATKVGANRDAEGGWPTARTPEDLRQQVRDNLESLGAERLDLVNMRMGDANGPQPGSIAEAMETLAGLQQEELIGQLGVSNVTAEQVAEARAVTPIVCVQNMYNLANRWDDHLIDSLAADNIAYVPFFPLGGFSPLQADALTAVGEQRDLTLADGSQTRRSGYVTEAWSLQSDGGLARKALLVRPWIALLGHSLQSRIWQDKSTIEIVEDVFADHASIAAWQDEAHVHANRDQYRAKYDAVLEILQPVLDVQRPDGSFYLWAKTPVADTEFARGLLEHYNVVVLPGSFLAREAHGVNPGAGFVRIALVADLAECVEAARRIAAFAQQLSNNS